MSTDQLALIDALKHVLKKKSKTYKQVAEYLGVSEATIKRWFGEGDMNLGRLQQICQWLGIGIFDLADVAKRQNEPLNQLTALQQDYLASNPQLFYLLGVLQQGMRLTDIMADYGLPEVVLYRLLRQLEANEFIELLSRSKYRLRVQGRIAFSASGPLRPMLLEMNQRFLALVVERAEQNPYLFESGFRYLSPASFNELSAELVELADRYRAIGSRDAKLLPKHALIPVKWTLLAGEMDHKRVVPLADYTQATADKKPTAKQKDFPSVF